MAPRASEQQRGERPARGGDGQTAQEQEAYVPPEDRGESYGDPDVLLDVPSLNVEEIDLEVEDLRAKVSFQAELADLVKINVGLDVELGRVKLQIKGVEAQVQLKARLDNVRAIFSEVLGTLQDNPQFFRDASGERRGHRRDGCPGDGSRERHERRQGEGQRTGCGPLDPGRHGLGRAHHPQGRGEGREGLGPTSEARRLQWGMGTSERSNPWPTDFSSRPRRR